MNTSHFSRRGLIAAGVVAGGAALADPAALASTGPRTKNSTKRPDGVPNDLPHPIASPPVPGVTYIFREEEEFVPEAFAAGRAWGGSGMYGPNGGTNFAVGFDLPPGAVLYDVEWYAFNSSGSSFPALLRIWSAGTGALYAGGVDTMIPSGGGVSATRAMVPGASNGPFPHGCRAVALAEMGGLFGGPSSQINGVRLGYLNGPTGTVLLPNPVRVYNSASHDGPLGSGHSRTHDLSSRLPAGAIGAIVNVQVFRTVGAGYLVLYAAGAGRPGTSNISWFGSGQTLSNQAMPRVSGGRKFTVYAGGGHTTQYLIDLVGYLV